MIKIRFKKYPIIHCRFGNFEFSIGRARIDRKFSIYFGPAWNGPNAKRNEGKKRHEWSIGKIPIKDSILAKYLNDIDIADKIIDSAFGKSDK